ncbi:MAG: hypothetical protein HRT57_00410 [Crocinitomicaceae bacterium]|nr:hypothetical protein [Crocinitomicaceae bacterium]
MAGNNQFIPLRKIIPWPEEFFPSDGNSDAPNLLDFMGVQNFSYSKEGSGRTLELELSVKQPVSLGVGVLPEIELVFGTEDEIYTFETTLVIGKESSLTISEIDIIIRLSTDLFKPAVLEGEEYIVAVDESGNQLPYDILLEGIAFSIDSDFNLEFEIEDGLTFPPLMIGDSGVVIEAEGIQLVLSKAADSDPGFYMESANIYLPEGLTGILPD